jgi:hypothetical protein
MGGKDEARSHFDDCLENCENIIRSYEDMEIKHNDIISGKYNMSEGIDPTSD